jgi:hypothetical protein
VLAEVTNTMHISCTMSDTPVKIIVFYASAVGKPLTITQPRDAHAPQ